MVICLIFRQRCVYLCVCVIDVESWLSCMNCRWLSRQHCHHVLVWPAWKAPPIRRQTFVLMLLCFCVYSSPVFVPSVLWHCWLGGRKGIRLVRNRVVGCWHCYLSGARCRFAYGPADATATHSLLLQQKIQIGFNFLILGHPDSPWLRAVKQMFVVLFLFITTASHSDTCYLVRGLQKLDCFIPRPHVEHGDQTWVLCYVVFSL